MPSLPDLNRTIRHAIADLLPRLPPWESLPPDAADRCAGLALHQHGRDVRAAMDQALPYFASLRDHAGQQRSLYGWMLRVSRIRCGNLEQLRVGDLPRNLVLARWHTYAATLRDSTFPIPPEQTVATPLGTFTGRSLEATQEAFVYDDLCSIHALFGIAVRTRSPSLIKALRGAVNYHVDNTQSDYITSAHPFALAAFGLLDETATFAAQQLHDLQSWYATHPEPVSGIAIFLLADALEQLKDAEGLYNEERRDGT